MICNSRTTTCPVFGASPSSPSSPIPGTMGIKQTAPGITGKTFLFPPLPVLRGLPGPSVQKGITRAPPPPFPSALSLDPAAHISGNPSHSSSPGNPPPASPPLRSCSPRASRASARCSGKAATPARPFATKNPSPAAPAPRRPRPFAAGYADHCKTRSTRWPTPRTSHLPATSSRSAPNAGNRR